MRARFRLRALGFFFFFGGMVGVYHCRLRKFHHERTHDREADTDSRTELAKQRVCF